MFCVKCGTQIPEGSRFCMKCGSKINEANVAAVSEDEESKTIAILPDMESQNENSNIVSQGGAREITQEEKTYIQQETVQMSSLYTQPQSIPYTSSPQDMALYLQMPPKKRFVMPMAVNIIVGLLAILSVAVCVCVYLLGKPEEIEIHGGDYQAVAITENPIDDQTENLECDISDLFFAVEIPETEEALKAAELAVSYVIDDSDSRYLEYDELDAYSEDELFYAAFEIFARAGMDMSVLGDDIEAYFEGKTWYTPTFSIDDIENIEDYFNEYEIANMELIEEYLGKEYGYADMIDDME